MFGYKIITLTDYKIITLTDQRHRDTTYNHNTVLHQKKRSGKQKQIRMRDGAKRQRAGERGREREVGGRE